VTEGIVPETLELVEGSVLLRVKSGDGEKGASRSE
jgi:hypothetical protein